MKIFALAAAATLITSSAFAMQTPVTTSGDYSASVEQQFDNNENNGELSIDTTTTGSIDNGEGRYSATVMESDIRSGR